METVIISEDDNLITADTVVDKNYEVTQAVLEENKNVPNEERHKVLAEGLECISEMCVMLNDTLTLGKDFSTTITDKLTGKKFFLNFKAIK